MLPRILVTVHGGQIRFVCKVYPLISAHALEQLQVKDTRQQWNREESQCRSIEPNSAQYY
jgi:hypothetical protein